MKRQGKIKLTLKLFSKRTESTKQKLVLFLPQKHLHWNFIYWETCLRRIKRASGLLRLMSIELVMPSKHLILCSPLLLLPSILPASGSFLMTQFFTIDGQSTGASVLPMNIQNWFTLQLTSLISLQSKGLSRVFDTQIKSINSAVFSFHYGSALTSIHDYW